MKPIPLAIALLVAAMPAAAQKNRSATTDSTRTWELKDVQQLPQPLNVDDLRKAMIQLYPPLLYLARTSGRVEVRFRVDAHGVPDALEVMRSTEPVFDAPTLEALRKLRFSPALVDGKPVAVWVLLPVEWSVGAS